MVLGLFFFFFFSATPLLKAGYARTDIYMMCKQNSLTVLEVNYATWLIS